MIEEIQTSPSDRATCKECFLRIPKGTPRGVETKIKMGHTESSYFCYKCSSIILERDERELAQKIKTLKAELEVMIEVNKEIITKNEVIAGLE